MCELLVTLVFLPLKNEQQRFREETLILKADTVLPCTHETWAILTDALALMTHTKIQKKKKNPIKQRYIQRKTNFWKFITVCVFNVPN